jgi:predicted permease
MGATTSIFSLVDRLLFRSLPYPAAEELVSVGLNYPLMVDGTFMIANDYLHLKEQSQGFTALTSWRGTSECDVTEGRPQRTKCAEVEGDFLAVLGGQPVIGRGFTPEEDRRGGNRVAVISYGLWQARYGGNVAAMGQSIRVDGVSRQLIGVLPAGFEFPTLEQPDIVVPQALAVTRYAKGQPSGPVRVFGRLRSGFTPDRVREMSRAIITEDVPASFLKDVRVMIQPLRDFQIQNVKGASWALLGGTLGVLLIVCANVAGLLLARSASRARELVVRAALGASRWQLIRQQFTESLVLSATGGIAGAGLAWTLLRTFQALAPASIPRSQQAVLDGRVGLLGILLVVLCACIISVAPSLSLPRAEMLAGRRTVGDRGARFRHAMVAFQLAFSLVLLSMTGLLLHALWKMQHADRGFSADHVVTADITVGPERYPNTQARQQFFDQLTGRLRAMPGVTSVAISDTVPPSGFVHSRPLAALRAPGGQVQAVGSPVVAWRLVSPEYFDTLGISIRRGRGFSPTDVDAGDRPVVLSASLASRLFGTADPVNQLLNIQGAPAVRVIGVAADVSNNAAGGKPDPEYYVLRRRVTDPEVGRNASLVERALHQYDGEAFVTVRADVDASIVMGWIRTATAAMDSSVPVILAEMQDRIRTLSERERFTAFLFVSFALVGLGLTAAGLFGLVRFLVALRTREVGVRMALGATPREVIWMLTVQPLPWIAGGLVVGAVASMAASELWGRLLVESPALPWWVLAGGILVLGITALLAAVIPASQAGRIDPMVALRQE